MRVVLLCCALAGCFSPAPQENAPCTAERLCPSGLECNFDNKCVKPGGDGPVMVDACPENACNGDVLVGCGTMMTCENGCGGTTPHCLTLAPSNGLGAMMLAGATADMNMDKLNFDAGDGSIKIMNVEIRPGGAGVQAGIRWEMVNGVSVWTANTWTLAETDGWSFTSSTPVALFAATSISIAAPINMNATTNFGVFGGTNSNGSTSLVGCQGRAGRSVDGTHADGGGGGGGGNGVKGGDGAGTNTGTNTGIGGACATRPSTTPLLAGNGGGATGATFGGGGGGAIALVAMESVTIANTSSISVSGAGGAGGGNGGGGGGGGGAILIEAPDVMIVGQLTANGGGGGAPGGGTSGGDGSTSTSTVAQGGTYSGAGGPARGGNGAAGTTTSTNGTRYNDNVTDPVTGVTTNFNRGGGGGGAAGKIEVKRKAGTVTGLSSPAAAITNAVFE